MALPPTIPTSFVPKQPVLAKRSTSGFNPFLVVSYFILAIWVIIAILVFVYQIYLSKSAEQKRQQIVVAQNNIDQATVTDFIRLRDRFTTAKSILDKHIVTSHFFDDLESVTIQNVHFTSLKLAVKETGSSVVEMQGVARNFNALAAQSTAFTNDKHFKHTIFSGFVLDSKNNTVTFQVNAELDPTIITDSVAAYVPPAQSAQPSQTAPQAPASTTTPKSVPQLAPLHAAPTTPAVTTTKPSQPKP